MITKIIYISLFILSNIIFAQNISNASMNETSDSLSSIDISHPKEKVTPKAPPLQKNINKNFWLNYFNFDSLASIATFITALIVLATLKEMKRQHKISMTPYLSVAPTSFRTTLLDNDKIETIRIIGDSSSDDFNKQSGEQKSENFIDGTYIRIDNIGLGTAKNIKVRWIFDSKFEEIFNSISNKYHNNIIKISNGMFQYPNNPLLTIYFPKDEYIHYLLPSSIRNNPIQLYIPEPYMFLFFLHMRLIFDNEQSKQAKIPDFPGVNLYLEYEDIENTRIKKTFSLTPIKSFTGRPVDNMKSLEITYTINVRELN